MSPHQNNDVEDVDVDIDDGKVFALLSYLGIFCFIPLLFKKENKFVLSHAKQGLVLFLGEVAIFIIQIVLGVTFLQISLLVLGVLSFVGIIGVLKGKFVKIPIVFDIAEKIVL